MATKWYPELTVHSYAFPDVIGGLSLTNTTSEVAAETKTTKATWSYPLGFWDDNWPTKTFVITGAPSTLNGVPFSYWKMTPVGSVNPSTRAMTITLSPSSPYFSGVVFYVDYEYDSHVKLDAIVDFPTDETHPAAAALDVFSAMDSSELSAALASLGGGTTVLGGMKTLIGGEAGVITKVVIPQIAGNDWSIMRDLALSSKVKVTSMRFLNHNEFSSMKDAFNIGASSGALLGALTAALPDVTMLTMPGLSESDWGY